MQDLVMYQCMHSSVSSDYCHTPKCLSVCLSMYPVQLQREEDSIDIVRMHVCMMCLLLLLK